MSNTNIKWFSSDNLNSPVLGNNWGSLLSLYDACLVDGFNQLNITSATVSNLKADNSQTLITFKYLQPHGYLQYQVIGITGSEVPAINGEKRIYSVSEDKLSLSFLLETSILDVGSVLNIFTKLASLGWKKVFTDVGQAIYQMNSPNGPNHYFFVNDKLQTGYTTTWGKYATVALAEDIGEGFNPKGMSSPVNFKDIFLRTVDSAIELGANVLFYATHTEVTTAGHVAQYTPGVGNRSWMLTGDPSYFYLFNATITNNQWFQISGCGTYDCVHQGFKYNTFLIANRWANIQSGQACNLSIDINSAISSISGACKTLKSYSLDSDTLLNPFSIYSTTNSGSTSYLSSAAPVNLFRINLMDPNKVLMGMYKNVSWLGVNMPFPHKHIFKQGDEIYLAIQHISQNVNSQLVFRIG